MILRDPGPTSVFCTRDLRLSQLLWSCELVSSHSLSETVVSTMVELRAHILRGKTKSDLMTQLEDLRSELNNVSALTRGFYTRVPMLGLASSTAPVGVVWRAVRTAVAHGTRTIPPSRPCSCLKAISNPCVPPLSQLHSPSAISSVLPRSTAAPRPSWPASAPSASPSRAS